MLHTREFQPKEQTLREDMIIIKKSPFEPHLSPKHCGSSPIHTDYLEIDASKKISLQRLTVPVRDFVPEEVSFAIPKKKKRLKKTSYLYLINCSIFTHHAVECLLEYSFTFSINPAQRSSPTSMPVHCNSRIQYVIVEIEGTSIRHRRETASTKAATSFTVSFKTVSYSFRAASKSPASETQTRTI